MREFKDERQILLPLKFSRLHQELSVVHRERILSVVVREKDAGARWIGTKLNVLGP